MDEDQLVFSYKGKLYAATPVSDQDHPVLVKPVPQQTEKVAAGSKARTVSEDKEKGDAGTGKTGPEQVEQRGSRSIEEKIAGATEQELVLHLSFLSSSCEKTRWRFPLF